VTATALISTSTEAEAVAPMWAGSATHWSPIISGCSSSLEPAWSSFELCVGLAGNLLLPLHRPEFFAVLLELK
jgi:hypothetical protein